MADNKFEEVLLKHPETGSYQYATDAETLTNLLAMGWDVYTGKEPTFKVGKEVPFGSTVEAPVPDEIVVQEPVTIDEPSTPSK